MAKRKITNLTKRDLPEIPSREKLVVPELDYGMGEKLGGWAIGSNDITKKGKSLNDIGDAIDTDGNVIADIINDRFNTATKTILSDFTFGASGAIQIGEYSAGVSGDIRISPNGIVGRNKSNETTFSIDGTTGDGIFGGELVAAYGTFGTITAGIFNGVEINGTNITGGIFYTSTDMVILEGTGATDPTGANDNYIKGAGYDGYISYISESGNYYLWYDDPNTRWKLSNSLGGGTVYFEDISSSSSPQGTYNNVNGTGTFVLTHVGVDKITINELEDGRIRFYDDLGRFKGYVEGDGLRFYDNDEEYAGQIKTSSVGTFELTAANDLQIQCGTSEDIEFRAGGLIRPYPDSGTITNWRYPQLGDADHQYYRLYARYTTVVSSDKDKKKDIVDSDIGLKDILKLKPVKYKWKKQWQGKKKDDETHIGLLADNVRQTFPYEDIAVDEKGYSPSGLIPVLIKAIQELNEEVEKLKTNK